MKTAQKDQSSSPSGTRFRQILDSFALKKNKPHQPRFRIERDRIGWRIFDGEKALALFTPTWFDIWSFSPFEPDEIANVEPLGKVADLHTVHNTTLNLGTPLWPPHWQAQGNVEQRVKLTWLKKSGMELLLRLSAEFDDGESGKWLLRVHYDSSWGRYRYTWDIDVRKYDPAPMEGFNLMTAGALVDRVEHRRWTHSVCENADGELARIVHSSALFFCTDYAGGAGVTRDPGGPWRYINASYPSAWVGYLAHPSFNPVILVHRTNVPLGFATCSQLFDQHIIWNRAGRDNLDEDGYFRFHMKTELVNLGPQLAADLLKKAKDPIKPKRWRQNDIALPFYTDRVNTFSAELDPWKPEECPILQIPRSENGPLVWDKKVGHNDHHSIRLTNSEPHGRLEIHPIGAVCRVKPQHRYRLTGWIKTRGVDRFARLELFPFEYSYSNITGYGSSAMVAGTRNWTHVEVEVETGDSVYLLPKLALYGTGTAWFDDLQLEEKP